MFLSLRCFREWIGARQCQSTVGCSRQGLTNRGAGWWDASCCPHPPPPLAISDHGQLKGRAASTSTVAVIFGWATGQAAARHPAHTQGTWPWVNWQMPGLWVCLWSAVTLRSCWPYCTGHTHASTCVQLQSHSASLKLPVMRFRCTNNHISLTISLVILKHLRGCLHLEKMLN